MSSHLRWATSTNAGLLLALAASPASAGENALLGVGITIEPACAVATAPHPAPSPARDLDDAATLLQVACNRGTSWSVASEPAPDAGMPVEGDQAVRPLDTSFSEFGETPARQPIGSRGADDPSIIVRITVRY